MSVTYRQITETRTSPFDGTTEVIISVRDLVDSTGTARPGETYEFANGTADATILETVTASLQAKGIPI